MGVFIDKLSYAVVLSVWNSESICTQSGFLRNKKIYLVDKIKKIKKKNNKCMVAFFCPLHASYILLIKYVKMRETFVDMQDNYVNMQH